LQIDVKLPNGQVADAKLVHSHEYYDLAILNIDSIPPGFQPEYLSLDHGKEFESYIDVVAAWRSHKTGEIETAAGTLDDIPTNNQHYWSSTCEIKTVSC
jgi:S1-C subfamily serine protease